MVGQTGSRSNLLKHIEKLRRFKGEYPNSAITFISLAKIYMHLGDSNTAKTELEKALEIEPKNFQAIVMLGRVEQALGNYLEAFTAFKLIKDEYGFDSQVVDATSIRLAAIGYFINQLYSGAHAGIIEDTHKWEEHPTLKDLLGVNRARAWKRMYETIPTSEEKTKTLIKAINILEKIIKEFGCPEWAKGTFTEVIGEFVSMLEAVDVANLQIVNAVIFVEKYIFEIYQENSEVVNLAKRFRKLSKINENPFRSKTWGKFLDSEGGYRYVKDDTKSKLSELGYLSTTIYHLPRENHTILFTKDENGHEYVVHHKVVENFPWTDWLRLKIGDHISIIPEEFTPSGKTTRARTAYII